MSNEKKTDPEPALMIPRSDRLSRFLEDFAHTVDEFPRFGRRLSSFFHDELSGDFDPRVDLRESEEGYLMSADLPGMTKEDVHIDVTPSTITHHGEKRKEREEKREAYHLVERRYGAFSRTLRLPMEVDTEKASAMFKDGVLTVSLPKVMRSAPSKRSLDIKTEM
jgi:HSP20 family protein